ncbi:hypothetical protein J3B02_003490, partial [Coemansia erecta]
MFVKCNLALAALLAAKILPAAQCYEVDLEWEVSPATKGISTAISLLRFTNETAPPSTEWIPLGWSHGSMSLQHRGDRSSFVSMQISPPSSAHQVILGRTSDIADVKYKPTIEGPSQVFLEAKVDLDASQPYYFKVEAHHDLKQNRTTYEGLYSMGSHWLYMGSLVLQHPNATDAARVLVSQPASAADIKSSASADMSDPKSRGSSQKDSANDSGSDSESEGDSDSEASSSTAAARRGVARHSVRQRITSSARRLASEDERNNDEERDNDSEDDDDKDNDKDSDSDNDKDRDSDSEKDSDDDEKDGDNERDSDDERDGDNDRSHSRSSVFRSSAPRSSAPAARASKKKLALYEMDSPMTMPGSQHSHHRSIADDSFDSFLHAGFEAFRSHRLPHTTSSPSAMPATSVAAATRAAMVPAADKPDDLALGLLKNGIEFPDFIVFPKIFSGIRRMDGGDPKLTRAGVYKKFQLRDRLGETLFVSQGHAFSYDGTDDDVASVRHFFMSASYLLSIDGAKLPSADVLESESLAEKSAT